MRSGAQPAARHRARDLVRRLREPSTRSRHRPNCGVPARHGAVGPGRCLRPDNPAVPTARRCRRRRRAPFRAASCRCTTTTSAEDAARAGEELTNPFTSDDAAAVGARRRRIRHLLRCRATAATGRGDGPVACAASRRRRRFAAENALKLKDGQMFHILTYGQKNMASYASQVAREDRWKAILHVRSLQRGQRHRPRPRQPRRRRRSRLRRQRGRRSERRQPAAGRAAARVLAGRQAGAVLAPAPCCRPSARGPAC